MAVMSDIHFSVFELDICEQTIGKRMWQQIYDYPETGIALWYSDFANSDIVGSAYALYPFIRFPLLKKKRIIMNFRFGLGLGVFSKKFDRLENYKNLAIGSHLNGIINLMIEGSFRLNDRFRLTGGISLTHFSTGTIELPNYGINIPAANLGVSYNIRKNGASLIKSELPQMSRKLEYMIIASTGLKEISPIENKKYFVYNVSMDIMKPIRYKYKIGGGIDLFYDNSKADALKEEGISDNNFNSNSSIGVHFTYEQVISKISIMLELGTYIINKHNIGGNLYEKLMINYFFTSKYCVSVSLKAHYARADYLTWGLGYKL